MTKRLDLAMLSEHDGLRQPRRVFERPTHESVVLNATTVVGEDADTRCSEFGHRRQRIAFAADRDRPRGTNIAQARSDSCIENLANDRNRIDGWFGVRHSDNCGVAAERRRPTASFNRFGFFATRLAQVSMDVDKPRSNHASGGIDGRGIVQTEFVEIECSSDCSDCPVGSHRDIGNSFAGAVDNETAGDDPSC
ncbi:unannotated protein [freshwater metagenome]|uniref:Unannotated protein n=1 Tax=freshwater metagenome TaxID=449393 RepID=A0A6J6JV94_9ZZZZ